MHRAVLFADDGAVDVVARAFVTAAKVVRIGVDEFGFAAGDRRTFAVSQARIDGKRGCLRRASELDRALDGKRPAVVEIEIGRVAGEPCRIGETGEWIVGSETRDRDRLVDRGAYRVIGEVRGAGVTTSLSDEDGDGDALVAVVGYRFDFAFANRDREPDRLRHVGLGGRGAAGFRAIEDHLGDAIQRRRRYGKLPVAGRFRSARFRCPARYA